MPKICEDAVLCKGVCQHGRSMDSTSYATLIPELISPHRVMSMAATLVELSRAAASRVCRELHGANRFLVRDVIRT